MTEKEYDELKRLTHVAQVAIGNLFDVTVDLDDNTEIHALVKDADNAIGRIFDAELFDAIDDHE